PTSSFRGLPRFKDGDLVGRFGSASRLLRLLVSDIGIVRRVGEWLMARSSSRLLRPLGNRLPGIELLSITHANRLAALLLCRHSRQRWLFLLDYRSQTGRIRLVWARNRAGRGTGSA